MRFIIYITMRASSGIYLPLLPFTPSLASTLSPFYSPSRLPSNPRQPPTRSNPYFSHPHHINHLLDLQRLNQLPLPRPNLLRILRLYVHRLPFPPFPRRDPPPQHLLYRLTLLNRARLQFCFVLGPDQRTPWLTHRHRTP